MGQTAVVRIVYQLLKKLKLADDSVILASTKKELQKLETNFGNETN